MDDKVEKPSVKAARALKPYFTNSVGAAGSIGILPATVDNIAAIIEEEMSRAVSPSPTSAEYVREQAAKIAELWEDEKHVNPARAIARAIRELKVVAPSPTNKDSETEDSGEMKTSPLSPNLKVS